MLALALTGCAANGTASSYLADEALPTNASRPNILFVLIDDMGYADLSATGNRQLQTPALDTLANEGLLFTQFYLGAAVCSPSWVAFFTGDFPAEHGFVSFIHDRQSNRDWGQVNWLDPKEPNVARMLADAGYTTGHFGKWHMGGGRDIGDAPLPAAYGFDESFVNFEGLGPRVLIADHPSNLSKQSAALGRGPVEWLPKHALTARYIDRLRDFVARHRGGPWFAQLWLDDVHSTWQPSAEQLAAVEGLGRSPTEERYFAILKAMDDQIGKFVRWLDESGEGDNTLIIVASDNGPEAGARYYRGGQVPPGDTGGLRGRKWSLYEGGIRSPLILRWPARIAAGRTDSTSVAAAVDLMPTLARLANATAPGDGDGIDLGPALAGEAIAQRPPLLWGAGPVFSDASFPQPSRERDRSPPFAVRDGRWKLLRSADGSHSELYDLSRDANEATNLAHQHPEDMRRLGNILAKWRASLQPRRGDTN